MRLAGKIALVTGAASGFGEGIAKKFVAEGARVVVVDRDGEGALRAAARLGAAALGVRADVTIGADGKAMVEAVHERFGGLDILVNNAGMGHLPQPLEDLPEDEFDRILAVNVKAIYRAAKEVVPRFKAQKKGVILNIASTAGVSPRPRLAWYNASKGWVITATRAMASWTPQGNWGFAQGIVHSFARIGNAVTPPIMAGLLVFSTWRSSFVILGTVSLLWLVGWVWYFRDDPREHSAMTPEALETLPVRAGGAAPAIPWPGSQHA